MININHLHLSSNKLTKMLNMISIHTIPKQQDCLVSRKLEIDLVWSGGEGGEKVEWGALGRSGNGLQFVL